MKWLHIILCIYVTVLSCIPCNDEGNCHTRESNITVVDTQHEQEHETDLCSPFCTCNGCGCSGATLLQLYTITYKPTVPIEKIYSVFIPNSIDNYTGDVWQPPKVC